jgi:hypothetical protein
MIRELFDSIKPHLIDAIRTEKIGLFVAKVALRHNTIRLQVCRSRGPGREGKLLACHVYIDIDGGWQ